MNAQELEQWAYTHETSREIALAIEDLANGVKSRMEKIWQDPTEEEKARVLGQALSLADDETTELYWGSEIYANQE